MPILVSLNLNNDDTRLINLPSPQMFDLGSDVYKSACLPMSLLAFLFFSFFLCKFQCILLSIQSTFKVRCSGWEVWPVNRTWGCLVCLLFRQWSSKIFFFVKSNNISHLLCKKIDNTNFIRHIRTIYRPCWPSGLNHHVSNSSRGRCLGPRIESPLGITILKVIYRK